MSEPIITIDELLAEMQRLDQSETSSGGMTTREMVDRLGKPTDCIRERVRQLLTEGKIELCQKQFYRIDGRLAPVSAYRLVKAKEVEREPTVAKKKSAKKR